MYIITLCSSIWEIQSSSDVFHVEVNEDVVCCDDENFDEDDCWSKVMVDRKCWRAYSLFFGWRRMSQLSLYPFTIFQFSTYLQNCHRAFFSPWYDLMRWSINTQYLPQINLVSEPHLLSTCSPPTSYQFYSDWSASPQYSFIDYTIDQLIHNQFRLVIQFHSSLQSKKVQSIMTTITAFTQTEKTSHNSHKFSFTLSPNNHGH